MSLSDYDFLQVTPEGDVRTYLARERKSSREVQIHIYEEPLRAKAVEICGFIPKLPLAARAMLHEFDRERDWYYFVTDVLPDGGSFQAWMDSMMEEVRSRTVQLDHHSWQRPAAVALQHERPANPAQPIARDEPAAGAAAKTVTGTLADLIREEPADIREILPVAVSIAERLAEIHASGEYTRGVSPRQVRMIPGGRPEIERFVTQGDTPAIESRYFAPEMFGNNPQLTPAADIYSTGLMLYEILAGAARFREQFGDGRNETHDMFWYRWHTDGSQRLAPLVSVVPDVPQRISELLEGMTQKDPAARPSWKQVVEALMRARLRSSRQDLPRPVRRLPPTGPGVDKPDSTRSVWIWVAAVAAAAAIVLAVRLWLL